MIDKLTKDAAKGELNDAICAQLMELRDIFKDIIKDPLATKLCRLSAEHIGATGTFDFDISDEDEDAEEKPFLYFLEILRDPTNKYNREELTAYKLGLKEVSQH